ncbi:MAG: lspA [Solirubrobacterales bacterium]|nr:lspA [Solirubrobacterales bacterium]
MQMMGSQPTPPTPPIPQSGPNTPSLDAPGAKPEQGRQRPHRGGGPWLLAALVVVCVVAVDQLTKHWVESSIVPSEEHKLLPGIQLVYTRNRGVAFGFLPGNHVAVTILIALALVVLLVYFARHSARALLWLPTGMIAGGALGNIVDRLRHGSVTDFIKLPLGWPPFNLADTSITLGVLILFVLVDRARAPKS